jgi:hypothetical protein
LRRTRQGEPYLVNRYLWTFSLQQVEVLLLKQQLKNSETRCINQEEISTLYHGVIDTLKEKLRQVATKEEYERIMTEEEFVL